VRCSSLKNDSFSPRFLSSYSRRSSFVAPQTSWIVIPGAGLLGPPLVKPLRFFNGQIHWQAECPTLGLELGAVAANTVRLPDLLLLDVVEPQREEFTLVHVDARGVAEVADVHVVLRTSRELLDARLVRRNAAPRSSASAADVGTTSVSYGPSS
jgi:hypothetical protein